MRTVDEYDLTIYFTPPAPGELPKFWSEPEPLEVAHGTHRIRMNLVTVDPNNPDASATFASRAVDWCDADGYLVVCPPSFSLVYSPLQLVLEDRNLAGCDGVYKFIAYVTYAGFTYGSPDPTIINKQPGGKIVITFDEKLLGKKRGRASAA